LTRAIVGSTVAFDGVQVPARRSDVAAGRGVVTIISVEIPRVGSGISDGGRPVSISSLFVTIERPRVALGGVLVPSHSGGIPKRRSKVPSSCRCLPHLGYFRRVVLVLPVDLGLASVEQRKVPIGVGEHPVVRRVDPVPRRVRTITDGAVAIRCRVASNRGAVIAILGDPVAILGDPVAILGDPVAILGDPVAIATSSIPDRRGRIEVICSDVPVPIGTFRAVSVRRGGAVVRTGHNSTLRMMGESRGVADTISQDLCEGTDERR